MFSSSKFYTCQKGPVDVGIQITIQECGEANK